MRFGKRLSGGVVVLAWVSAMSVGRMAAAQSPPVAPPPAPEPPSAESDASDPFDSPDAPRAGNRRNLIWDRAAQQRLEAERRRLEADMRRLEGERRKLEAELRRAQESMRRGERETRRETRRGPGVPAPRFTPPPPMTPPPGGMPPGPGIGGPRPEPAPMAANPFAQPPQAGSDWERELMRAHGFSGAALAGGPGPFLGVSASPAPDSLRGRLQLPSGIGLVVNSIEPGSPAEQAGLNARDVLHKLDEQLLVNTEQLTVLVRTYSPGQEVRLTVVRGGKPTQLTVKLGQRNLSPLRGRAPGQPGMRAAPMRGAMPAYPTRPVQPPQSPQPVQPPVPQPY